jgi:membrane protease YdiL (CAAX protease family)
MSETPFPPQPLDYDAPRPPPAPRWPGYLAWAVIFLIVGLTFLGNIVPELRGRKQRPRTSTMQLEMIGKYAVGLGAMAPGSAGALVQQIQQQASTPGQRLDVAMLAGELQDAEAALKRMDQIDDLDDELEGNIAALKTIYESGPQALDEGQRQRLLKRHGFFGKLALTYKLPESDPLRREVVAAGKRTVLTFFAAFVIIIGLGATGLILLILGIVFLAIGKLIRHYVPSRDGSTVYVEMFAVYLVSFVGLGLMIGMLGDEGSSSLSKTWLLSIVVPIAIGYGLLRGQSWAQVRQALGLHGGKGVLIEAPLGIVGYIAGIPVVVIGFLITFALMRLSGSTASHPIQDVPTDTPMQILALYGIASVWAPVIEEIMFRGALFNHMRQSWNWVVSASVVALIFAAIHPQGWTTIPVLGSIAIVLAGIREWRGSIIAPIVAHGFSNGMVVTLLVLVK